MKVNYNIQKEERKAMVAVVSKVLDTKPVYCGAPTFSYKIGAFEIMKDGSLWFDDATDEATLARVRTALREEGFMSEDGEHEASCGDTGANEPILKESTVEEVARTEEAMAEPEEDSLSISLPRTLFTEMSLKNHVGDFVRTEAKEATVLWLHEKGLPAAREVSAAYTAALQESAEKETGWCRFRDRIFLPLVIDGAIWMTGKMLESMAAPHSVK